MIMNRRSSQVTPKNLHLEQKNPQRFADLPHRFSWSLCNEKLLYFRWQFLHAVSCFLRLVPPTTTMSSEDAITDSVLLSLISTTPGKSSRINSDSSSSSRETSSVSTTISISFSKPNIKLCLSYTSAIIKDLFYKSRRGNVNFFMSDYEITTECVAGSNLSYANDRYRNQNKDRNTGGFNKMHVHSMVPHNTKKIQVAYKSKRNLTREKQVILLMISNGENWHYIVVKNLPGITSNHKEDFYCLNCFHSYRTKNKLEAHKKICENHDCYHVEMPTKDNNIIKYNQEEKSIKLPFVVYADLECLLEKMSTCQNNPRESSATEINKHAPSGYSLFTHCSFEKLKNKLDHYRGKDCMKKFCKDLRTHATKIINYEKKKMIPLTIKEKIHYNEQEICYICKKEFDKSDKKHYKVRDHCHYTGKCRGAGHNTCNLRYKIPKEIPVVFHNGSTYDYHFIIKELVKEFDGNFKCLGENTEKYITFSVPIKKKIENKNIEITYKIMFIDSYRFMSMPLSKLIDNLPEGLHNNKCLDCKSGLDYNKTKNEKLILKCINCKQHYEKDFNKELIKRFALVRTNFVIRILIISSCY